jgi:hypothetical protein
LASTIIGLLANMGMHMVFSSSTNQPAQIQQMQNELTDRIKADAEIRTALQLAEKERAQMHEHQALIDQRLDYLEAHHR